MKFKRIIAVILLSLIASQAIVNSALAAPEEVLVNGPMTVWDYYLAPYDQNGKIMVFPTTTSFSTIEVVDDNVPPVYAPGADSGQDVVIKISNNEKYKNWQKNVYKVILKNPYHEAPTSGMELQFRSVPDENVIILSANNQLTNGLHQITIFSHGYNIVGTKIEVLNPAPTMQIISGMPKAGQEVKFELLGLNYGINNPIYEVVLDGTTLAGNFVDYYVVSNRVIISNTALITEGLHSLTVKADGHHNATYQFLVGENGSNSIGTMKLDAVSSATRGGDSGSGDVDGVSGATGTMVNADVVFKFDMVANAYILNVLQAETAASSKVFEAWNNFEGSRRVGARTKDSKRYADWNTYMNQAMQCKILGEYLDFENFYQSENDTYRGTPFNIKYMLENGRYGDIIDSSEADGKKVEVSVLTAHFNEDVVLGYTDSDWAKAIHTIRIGSTELYKSQYTVSGNTISIHKAAFLSGENLITIAADGYTTYTQVLVLEPSEVQLTLEGTPHLRENVSILLPAKYAKEITGITLNGKALYTESQTGAGASYKIEQNRLVIFAKEFKDTNVQSLGISASGYGARYYKFQLLPENAAIDFTLPSITEVREDENTFTIVFDREHKNWQESVYRIEMGILSTVAPIDTIFNGNQLIINKDMFNRSFTKITLKANGYENLTFEKKAESLITPAFILKQSNTAEKILLSVENSAEIVAYMDKITSVSVNGNEVAFSKDITNGTLEIINSEYSSLSGEIIITVKAHGYNDTAIKVTLEKAEEVENPEVLEPGKVPPTSVFEKVSAYYRVSISGQESTEWINAVGEIYINGSKLIAGRDYQKQSYSSYIQFYDSAFVDSGLQAIVIKSEGYKDVKMQTTIAPLYQAPSAAERTVAVKAGEAVKVKIDSAMIGESSYVLNTVIKNVLLNENPVGYNIVTEASGFMNMGKDYYLIIPVNHLPRTPGEYTVTVQARRYYDLQIKLVVAEEKVGTQAETNQEAVQEPEEANIENPVIESIPNTETTEGVEGLSE
ncbi:hypothetical protein acsn021_34560 [Anaerocolumna cellulosilytica]|uniref:Heme-binding protein Shr-like Hb-interacting domain-containing protein n=1 Tax=Anaerocolumna cellulosilytica TaxID=433286 RepID=A0A6S6R7A1_9FIRM|nr:hemoblobin-interacting domain-containing protein [Anaerocolumna cellulosilytica]MBB5195354.1 hypothetical protein [Anaerocolumna cellulosilytica]BCJ95887.1 hypothetical protein acsn021_34560 [Anaerocolumna cellulosilytica]